LTVTDQIVRTLGLQYMRRNSIGF